jgi:dTDP-4-dehydrorhamnose 3,5-epimerase
MIDGLIVNKLKQIADERGKIMHMLRADSPHFIKFGEIYFSVVNAMAIKAWKKHMHMTLNLAVPRGMIKLVVYDDRENSNTSGEFNEFIIGQENYCLITIPPKIWTGFKGISKNPAIVANCATMVHDPDEVIRAGIGDKKIPYSW